MLEPNFVEPSGIVSKAPYSDRVTTPPHMLWVYFGDMNVRANRESTSILVSKVQCDDKHVTRLVVTQSRTAKS